MQSDLYSTTVSVFRAQRVLDITHYAYPLILLVAFLVAFTARSIIVSSLGRKKAVEEPEQRTGPGGKPLPPRAKKPTEQNVNDDLDFSKPRKLLFNWLSVFLCFTFVVNAADVIAHALIKREEGWWCGQAPVVCYNWAVPEHAISLLTCLVLHSRWFLSPRSSPSVLSR